MLRSHDFEVRRLASRLCFELNESKFSSRPGCMVEIFPSGRIEVVRQGS